MLIYFLICLCLSLAGIAGLQFFYMIYLDRIQKQQKKHIRELENRVLSIGGQLEEAENRYLTQIQTPETSPEEAENEDELEIWADLLEEK